MKIYLSLIIIIIVSLPGCSNQIQVPPILLLATSSNYGTYTGEILKAEGFNEFIVDSLGSKKISKSYLSRFDHIILAEQVSDKRSVELLSFYVENGGNLIAVLPSESSSSLFGVEKMPVNVEHDYIEIDTGSNIGRSLAAKRIRNHAAAGSFKLIAAEAAAWFCDSAASGGKFPALVTGSFGKGKTAAFLYNMPENIVYTRQGNPESAGLEKDSIPGLRAMDLFTGGWVDTYGNTINQSDEQMRLLSHCLEEMSAPKKPLPRLWYFPDTLKCLVTLTNDGEFRGEGDFEPQFRDVDSMGARMSLYVLQTEKVSGNFAEKWSNKGFEIAGHPDDTREASSPVWRHMDSIITAKKKDISDLYGLKMTTVANHWFVWCGLDQYGHQEFAAQAELEESHGLGLDLNYAHYDNNSSQGHFLGPLGMDQGNFNGSGLPMKFASGKGKILDVYQHLNNVYDQQYTENHDPEGFFNCFKGLMDRSLSGQAYSFISVKCHNDEYYFSRIPLMKMLAYANSNRIPVWTASKLLDFIKMREEADFSDIEWKNGVLSFNLKSSLPHSNDLTFMVPYHYGNKKAGKIVCNNREASYITRSVKGTVYAFVSIKPGDNYSIQVNYAD